MRGAAGAADSGGACCYSSWCGHGEADIAIRQGSELLFVDGVTVGLLPASLQKIATYSATLMPGATAPEAARQLISFLTSSAGKTVFEARGWTPGLVRSVTRLQ
ncbi:MAG: substrate-binding domain-containing protein [Pseudomonadota bacterium]|nr:substrate-binding domain-containing protein [Pseudomonadota bacterium]